MPPKRKDDEKPELVNPKWVLRKILLAVRPLPIELRESVVALYSCGGYILKEDVEAGTIPFKAQATQSQLAPPRQQMSFRGEPSWSSVPTTRYRRDFRVARYRGVDAIESQMPTSQHEAGGSKDPITSGLPVQLLRDRFRNADPSQRGESFAPQSRTPHRIRKVVKTKRHLSS